MSTGAARSSRMIDRGLARWVQARTGSALLARAAFAAEQSPDRERLLQGVLASGDMRTQETGLRVEADAEPVAIEHGGCVRSRHQATTTGILPILTCHSRGPVWCTDSPVASTATVTGMSYTVNS